MHMVVQMFLLTDSLRARATPAVNSLVTDSRLRRTMKSRNDGAANVAMMATIATVTINSINVNPRKCEGRAMRCMTEFCSLPKPPSTPPGRPTRPIVGWATLEGEYPQRHA